MTRKNKQLSHCVISYSYQMYEMLDPHTTHQKVKSGSILSLFRRRTSPLISTYLSNIMYHSNTCYKFSPSNKTQIPFIGYKTGVYIDSSFISLFAYLDTLENDRVKWRINLLVFVWYIVICEGKLVLLKWNDQLSQKILTKSTFKFIFLICYLKISTCD